jgi:predicted hotdog family 3-hydroxylacyl-ACP dehydratase
MPSNPARRRAIWGDCSGQPLFPVCGELRISSESAIRHTQVPGHVGIEYMAQACGAYAGAQALDAGEPVKIGFLLGTRLCRVLVPWFRIGDCLIVTASIIFRDEQMAAFDCRVEIDGQLAADAQLKVYQPGDDEVLINKGDER